MNRTDWLLKFRRYHTLDMLDKVYEHLYYSGDPKEELAMTQAWDHRKADLTMGQLFERVPKHVWQYVK